MLHFLVLLLSDTDLICSGIVDMTVYEEIGHSEKKRNISFCEMQPGFTEVSVIQNSPVEQGL